LIGMAFGAVLGPLCSSAIHFFLQTLIGAVSGAAAAKFEAGSRTGEVQIADASKSWSRWPGVAAYLVFSILAVLVRLPLLLNADAMLDSDIAINALSVKHLVTRGEPILFHYGQRYLGLTEQLAALPWVAFFGWRSVSFALSPLVAWILLQGVIYGWILSNWGLRYGVAWLAIQVFVPVESLWISLQAYGGHLWATMIGVLCLAIFTRWLSASHISITRIALGTALQFVGLYTYSYYRVFLPVQALQILIIGRRSIAMRLGLAVCWLVVPLCMRSAIRIVADRVQNDRTFYPEYGPVSLHGAEWRWRLLTRQVMPLAMSLPVGVPSTVMHSASISLRAVEPEAMGATLQFGARLLYVVYPFALLALGTGLSGRPVILRWPLAEANHSSSPETQWTSGSSGGFESDNGQEWSAWPCWMILQLVTCLAAFVVFPYANYWECTRYLTIMQPLVILSLLAAVRTLWNSATQRPVARLAWRFVAASILVGNLAYFASLDATYYYTSGLVSGKLHVRRMESPSMVLARWLEDNRYSGMVGVADYWLSYSTSFLAQERTRVAPIYPPRMLAYDREAARLSKPLVLLPIDEMMTPPTYNGFEYRELTRLPDARIVVWQAVGPE
jgi:hypothetical protein